ncbi:MAG: MFS transporter [Acidimicrobiia bacterium]
MTTPVPGHSSTRRFAGWRILVLATFTGALTGPGQTIGVSVFVDWLIADLGLTRSEVSLAYLVGTITAALAMPVAGRMIDVSGVRKAMTVIGLGFGAALMAMSGVTGFVTLALGFVLIRGLGQGSLTLASTVAVTLWFEKRRGTMLGIYSTGLGMLMSLVPIGLSFVIEGVGWRTAWIVAGVVIWLTVVPIARFGMIDRPADIGQVPDGVRVEAKPGAPPARAASTRSEALRTWRFWVLVSASSAVGMLSTALNFHQISLLGDAGLTPTAAAAMFLPQTVGTGVAGLLFGVVSDRLTVRTLLPMSMALLAASLVLVSFLVPGPLVVLYAVLLGATGGASRTVSATLMPRWFGVTNIGAIQGVATFVVVASTAVGPVAFSVARDAAGDYRTAALLYALIPVAVAVAALTVKPMRV